MKTSEYIHTVPSLSPMQEGEDIEQSEQRGKWWRILRGVLIGWLCWTLYTFFHAQLIVLQEPSAPYIPVLIGSFLSSYIYGVLCFGVWPWTRFLFRRPLPVQVGGHILGAVLYAGVWYLAYTGSFIALWGRDLFEYTQMERYAVWIITSSGMLYGVVAGIFHTIRNRRYIRMKTRVEQELLLRASRMELAVLKSQLNPHFLFNTLNTVNSLIGSDPERARTVIAQLADTLRYSLDSDRRALVPLREEIRFVETYLAIARERFGDRLRSSIQVRDGDLDLLVPPMTLQPLVENAVRHGIAPMESGGKLTVVITHNGNMLHIDISDDGAGAGNRDADELLRGGHGLFNTDQRLKKMFGDESGLRLDLQPGGFRAAFIIPALKDSGNSQPIPAQAYAPSDSDR